MTAVEPSLEEYSLSSYTRGIQHGHNDVGYVLVFAGMYDDAVRKGSRHVKSSLELLVSQRDTFSF